MRNGIVHRTLTFLCIYHQKKASKLRISMLSLNAFFLIILLLLLFMSVLDNIYFPRFFRPMHLSRKAHDSESLLKYKGQNSIFYPLYFLLILFHRASRSDIFHPVFLHARNIRMFSTDTTILILRWKFNYSCIHR